MGNPTSDTIMKLALIGVTGGAAFGITDSTEIPVGADMITFPMAAGVVGFNSLSQYIRHFHTELSCCPSLIVKGESQ